MRITKTLYTSKKLADGSSPIVIMINDRGNRKKISTGEKTRYWNKASSTVGSKDPNYKEKNRKVDEVYLSILNRLSLLKENNIEATIENLLSEKPIENAERSNLIWLYKAKSDACKAIRTKNEYITFKKAMEALYGSYIDVDAIDQRWVDDMRRRIDVYYSEHNSQKNHFIKCFRGVYTFASENEFIKIPRMLKCQKFIHLKGETDLTNEQVSIIINAYKKDVVLRGRRLTKRQMEAISVFCLMMAFQGLSNIDLAALKIKDLEFSDARKIDVDVERYNNNAEYRQRVNDNQEVREVVIINTKRRKTEIPVKIVCDKESIIPILEMFYDGKRKDEYLIPCFSKKTEGKEIKEIQRCSNYYSQLSNVFQEYLDEYCEIWGYNKIPKITYYMSRHAFINRVSQMDIPHNLIRKFVGHKEGVLEKSYITPPTRWEQANVTYRIFNQEQTIRELLLQRSEPHS